MVRKYVNLNNLLTFVIFLLISIFGLCNDVEASLYYMNRYDTDELAETNPKTEDAVASYMIDGEQICNFSIAIAIDGETEGAEATLSLWNSIDSYDFIEKVDEYGGIHFVLTVPYSVEGYDYKVAIGEQSTQIRHINIDAEVSDRYDGIGVNWLTQPSDDIITITSLPFNVNAQIASPDEIMDADISMSGVDSQAVFPATISGNEMSFSIDNINDGEYNAVIMARTPNNVVSSSLKRIIVATGEEPRKSESVSGFFVRRTGPDELETIYARITRENIETNSNETVELINFYKYELADIYAFNIAVKNVEVGKSKRFIFNAYGTEEQLIYSEEKRIFFEPNVPQNVLFIIPKLYLSDEIAHIEIHGSLLKWTVDTAAETLLFYGIDAVAIDLGATGTFQYLGLNIGTGLVFNAHSREISTYNYKGGGGAVGIKQIKWGLAGRAGVQLVWNLEKNEKYKDCFYQLGGEAAAGWQGMHCFSFFTKDLSDGPYGMQVGWSGGLMASAGLSINKYKIIDTYTFDEFYDNPWLALGDMLGFIDVACDPNDFDGDGLPNDWEIKWGTNYGVNDANGDMDRDGVSNLDEYLHGTDPTDPTSYFDNIPPQIECSINDGATYTIPSSVVLLYGARDLIDPNPFVTANYPNGTVFIFDRPKDILLL